MLESLFLRNFVIVEQAEIEFASGFCVLSGETGAGKSILLDALGLALGNRADGKAVRDGAEHTEIQAAFKPSPRVREWLAAHALTDAGADAELRLRRLVMPDGRSKAFINGSPVTVGQLRELGGQLIEIHGQHAAQSLLGTDGQRSLLDDFARSGALADELRDTWTRWREATRLLEAARARQHELGAERDALQQQLDEISAIAPGQNEWQQLSADQNRLANGAGLLAATQEAAALLVQNDGSLSDQLGQLLARLRQQARSDAALEPALDLLDSARIQVVEAASELASYADRLDLDPARLTQVDARMGAMFALARKLRCEPEELAARAQAMGERLATLEAAQNLGRLATEADRLAATYDGLAKSLSRARHAAARALSVAVAAHLGALGMGSARFEVVVEAQEPGPNGIDRVEFRFAGHASLGLRALGKVASGGELSRVSLAIAVSAAAANPVDSMIFDEADAGVGGAVADAIGQLMRELGSTLQVLAVTHLPQVAARAHRHFRIERESTENGVNSRVTRLDGAARVEEIARMLGGASITGTTRDHAAELIALADAPPGRAGTPRPGATAVARRKPAAPRTAGSPAARKR